MKLIPLNQGQFAQVDDADYEWLMQWKWQAYPDEGRRWYVCRYEKRKRISMHGVILKLNKGQIGDHIDHDGRNNQRSNLRIATAAQNARNSRPNLVKKYSPYKGVSLHDPKGKHGINSKRWKARIRYNDIPISLGDFASDIEAAKEYDQAAIYYYGEYACTNFPRESYDGLWVPKIPKPKTSHFHGVFQRKGYSRWAAQLYANGKSTFIGYFATEIEAAYAYNQAACKVLGQNANLNVIPY